MAIEIKSPTFPESVADGTVANWVKKEGDQVNQDEIIAEIETDKVVLEVVSPTNGVLTKILNKEGDIVNSAEIIGEFDDSQQAQPQNKEKTETKEEAVLLYDHETPLLDDLAD
jgi:2-oxoglutarate dehydrogenase E2 component (dihydrolipoamide succinyltransferase)